MNQSTVPHTEVSLRLTILSEFLFDEEKSVEELYRSWMRRVGGRIMEYTEFEYWCRRFKNNQFDLGYDTSQDKDAVIGIPTGAQVSNDNRSETSNVSNEVNIDLEYDTSLDSKEIPEIQNTISSEANGKKDVSTMTMEKEAQVEVDKKQVDNSKLKYQFNEKDVPEMFQSFISSRKSGLKEVVLVFNGSACVLRFDDLCVRFVKINNDWTVTYKQINTTIETVNPEKSIVDHLWFVLRNPDLKLETFGILDYEDSKTENRRKLRFEKLDTLLQSMINSIDHQIQTNLLEYEGCNEDTFLSMLKQVKPLTLNEIIFDISCKEERNCQNLKEIVETDQWKQAEMIVSNGVTPLILDDLSHCERFWLELASFTPEDVLRVVEHVSNSSFVEYCCLSCKHEEYDIDAIIDFLRSQNHGSRITKLKPHPDFKLGYEMVKLGKHVILVGTENYIVISNN